MTYLMTPKATVTFVVTLTNEVGRVNHITRKARSLARMLILLYVTLPPSLEASSRSVGLWVPLNTRVTSPTMDNPVHYTSGRPRPLHQYHSTPAGHPNCPRHTSFFTDEQRRCIFNQETCRSDAQSHYAAIKRNVSAGHPSKR